MFLSFSQVKKYFKKNKNNFPLLTGEGFIQLHENNGRQLFHGSKKKQPLRGFWDNISKSFTCGILSNTCTTLVTRQVLVYSVDYGFGSCGLNFDEVILNKRSWSYKFNGMPCHAMLYHTIPCHTIPYHTIPYHTIPYHTIPYHTIPYHTIPYHTIPYHTIPYHTTPYHTIPYHTIPYHTIPYHTIPYHTIPYYTIPYHTIPYHTISYTIPYQDILYHATPHHSAYYTMPHHTTPYHSMPSHASKTLFFNPERLICLYSCSPMPCHVGYVVYDISELSVVLFLSIYLVIIVA